MKIGSVKIENFRSISSTEFSLSECVTAIAGGNESGKSNTLLAIHKFLSGIPFSLSDKYQLNGSTPKIEIKFSCFTQEDKERLSGIFNTEITELTILRDGEEYTLLSPDIDSKTTSQVDEAEVGATENLTQDNEGEIAIPEKSSKEIVESVRKILPKSEMIRSVESLIIGENILINELFPSDEVKATLSQDKVEKLDTVRALFEIGQITESDIKNPNLNERTLRLNDGAARIGKLLRSTWHQEDVKLRIIADQTSIVIHFRDGKNIPSGRKSKDDSFWIWTLPEDRSTGFRWYVTFYVRFLSRMNSSDNLIFLIDDVGSTLNKTAQEDLLSEFNKLTGKDTTKQIVYVTHSKYMVDWDSRRSIRLAIKEKGEGTKINELWWESYSRNELPSPLDELGVNWSDDILKHDNLIVEGHTDTYILHNLALLIDEDSAGSVFAGFKVISAGNAQKQIPLAHLCNVHDRKAMLLFDSDQAGKANCSKAASQFSSKKTIKATHLNELIGENPLYNIVTIEDLLPVDLFLTSLNIVGLREQGENWENIKKVYKVDEKGIVLAVKDRLIRNGIEEKEAKMFLRNFKYEIIIDLFKNLKKESYPASQLQVVETFLAKMRLFLEDIGN